MTGFLHDKKQNIDELVARGLHIAVVIPCYNVKAFISQVIRGIPNYVQSVIVVNDASKDGTDQVLSSIIDERVVVIQLEVNNGVGGAVLSGYKKAEALGADIIVKMDGDGQMNPMYLPNLLFPIIEKKANYTKGNRFLHSKELRSMPFVRRVGNLGLSFLTKLASGYWNVFDPTNGFTALDTTVLSSINPENIDRRYYFETSLLVELGLRRSVVQDVYIPACYGEEKSSLSTLHSFVNFPWKLTISLLRRLLYVYFVRDFSMVSLFLISGSAAIVFGTAWGLWHWVDGINKNLEASTGTVMIAVLPLIIGIQLLLQAVVMDIQNVPTQVLGE